jgi:hypothetical protein
VGELVTSLEGGEHSNDLRRFLDRYRTKQEAVGDAEYRRVGGDAHGQGEHGDRRETAVLDHHPPAVAEVLL